MLDEMLDTFAMRRILQKFGKKGKNRVG